MRKVYRCGCSASGGLMPLPGECLIHGWRPIDTAPMDGTLVLLSRGVGGPLIGSWSEAANYEYFQVKPGWQIFDCADGWYSQAINDATHWMPLPDPPGPKP